MKALCFLCLLYCSCRLSFGGDLLQFHTPSSSPSSPSYPHHQVQEQPEPQPGVHSLNVYFIGAQGFDLPEYSEVHYVDDVQVFYYDSTIRSVPGPQWLSNTPTGQETWRNLNNIAYDNKERARVALVSGMKQFNLTGLLPLKNIYQAHGRCDLHPNGTVQGSLTIAFNGQDFVSFDARSKTFTAAVPQAVSYKMRKERDSVYMEMLSEFYKDRCGQRVQMFVQYAPALQSTKTPEVWLFEKQGEPSPKVTCLVSGFYPRAVRVELLGPDLRPVSEGIIKGEVLPNGDGTYQTRASVAVPEGLSVAQNYHCVVRHRSGDVSRTLAVKVFKEGSTFWVIVTVVVVLCCALGLLWAFFGKSNTQNPSQSGGGGGYNLAPTSH